MEWISALETSLSLWMQTSRIMLAASPTLRFLRVLTHLTAEIYSQVHRVRVAIGTKDRF
jgi:hypothetical protein